MTRSVSTKVCDKSLMPWWVTTRDIFIAPEAAFRPLGPDSTWLAAYLINACSLLTYNLLIFNQTRILTENFLAQGVIPEGAETWGMVGFWFGVFVMPFVMPLVSAFGYTAILGFLAPFLGIKQTTFGKLYVLSMWAMVPAYTLGNLLRGIVAYFMSDASALVAVNLSLRALLPSDAPKLLTVAGFTLDLFALWTLALVAVGITSTFKSSWKTGFMVASVFLAFRFAWLGLSI